MIDTADQPGRLTLDDQLCFALYAATNAVVRSYRPMLGALGLTYPQYLVMLVLWQDGACAISAVATRLRLGPSAVTPLIDQLEAAGFVLRTRAVDRRVLIVAPTEAGARLEAEAAAVQREVVCRTGLSPKALAALRADLNALVDRMATRGLPPDEPAGSHTRRAKTAPIPGERR